MWFKRDIANALRDDKSVIQVLRGPRQCGKTSLFLEMDPSFKELSLDDIDLKHLANEDPALFLKQFNSEKIFIDEAQYAPDLFPLLKRKADLFKRENSKLKTIIRLTGSNQILMDRRVKESLAGRASFFDMNTLSLHEVARQMSHISTQNYLYRGGWPELYQYPDIKPNVYLNDYISSYIEKDIVLAAGIQKVIPFRKFLKLLAGRVGHVLDVSYFAKSLGVSSTAINAWLSVLETMHLIVLVQPFSNNLSKRLVKSPKVYFIDTGLACRLQGWSDADPILSSPAQGFLFENVVFGEIFKFILNHRLDWDIFHWRSKDKREIDFLVQTGPDQFVFIEAKVSRQRLKDIRTYPEVKKVFKEKIPKKIQCVQEGDDILGDVIPVRYLHNFFMEMMISQYQTKRPKS